MPEMAKVHIALGFQDEDRYELDLEDDNLEFIKHEKTLLQHLLEENQPQSMPTNTGFDITEAPPNLGNLSMTQQTIDPLAEDISIPIR